MKVIKKGEMNESGNLLQMVKNTNYLYNNDTFGLAI